MASLLFARVATRPTLAVGTLLMGGVVCFDEVDDGSTEKKVTVSRMTSFFRHPQVTLCEEMPPPFDEIRAKTKPIFTEDQVAQRNGRDSNEIWVTHADRVYDITEFVKEHKGGSFILSAAGGPIDDYWGYWAYHTQLQEPLDILSKYHIGYLKEKPEECVRGTAGILQLCNHDRHNVDISYVPIYHAFY